MRVATVWPARAGLDCDEPRAKLPDAHAEATLQSFEQSCLPSSLQPCNHRSALQHLKCKKDSSAHCADLRAQLGTAAVASAQRPCTNASTPGMNPNPVCASGRGFVLCCAGRSLLVVLLMPSLQLTGVILSRCHTDDGVPKGWSTRGTGTALRKRGHSAKGVMQRIQHRNQPAQADAAADSQVGTPETWIRKRSPKSNALRLAPALAAVDVGERYVTPTLVSKVSARGTAYLLWGVRTTEQKRASGGGVAAAQGGAQCVGAAPQQQPGSAGGLQPARRAALPRAATGDVAGLRASGASIARVAAARPRVDARTPHGSRGRLAGESCPSCCC
jgi:hypothetical protein